MKKIMSEISVGIITISDRAFNMEREDESGPALVNLCQNLGWTVVKSRIINDDFELIKSTLIDLSQESSIDLILTTGGTGLSPRDNTPEATLAVINKLVPGISEFIRRESYAKNHNAIISRAVSGVINTTLVINLPGSPHGAVESLQFVQQIIPHAVELLQGHQPHG
jgi:molybdopterin adenylyltransferase